MEAQIKTANFIEKVNRATFHLKSIAIVILFIQSIVIEILILKKVLRYSIARYLYHDTYNPVRNLCKKIANHCKK